MKIPFNKIYYTGKEIDFISDSMVRGSISGDGYYTRLAASMIEDKFNADRVMMTTSATHAMEMAAIITGLGPGDEVIMPSFTFPSTANAVMLRGAKIVFADIREETLNIDPMDIERKITPNTRTIMPVHYGGIACDMDAIMHIADKYGLYVIEDAAHGVNGKYKGRYLGTIGHMGCYSFHGTKDYVCGEGGAILLNTDDISLHKKGEVIRQKGTNRSQFIRGEVDKYSWVDIGSSYVPSDMLMAFLYAQLSQMDIIKSKRRRIHEFYSFYLRKYVEQGTIQMIGIPKDCESSYHLFYLLFKSETIRDRVIEKLRLKGISAATHFVPLHSSPMGQKLGYLPEELPVTEKAGRCLLRLPMYTDMREEEMNYVIENLEEEIKVIA